jgi:hypothetical protein
MNTDSTPDPFAELSYSERKLLYLGLVSLVKRNSGDGFQNCDQGHPAYAVGRSGKFDYDAWGDSPEHNKLFKLMHTLSVSLSEAEIDNSSEIVDYVFCWADFCQLAYTAYEESRG